MCFYQNKKYFSIIYLVTVQTTLALTTLILIIIYINQIAESIYISQINIGSHNTYLYPFSLFGLAMTTKLT